MSEDIPVTKIEGNDDELTFTLAGAEPDVVDGMIRQKQARASKFEITIAPRNDGVFEFPSDNTSIEINFATLYPSSGSADWSSCMEEVRRGSKMSLETTGQVPPRDALLKFPLPGKTRLSKQTPIVVSVTLAEARMDIMLITAILPVRILNGSSVLAEARFTVLGSLYNFSQAETEVGTSLARSTSSLVFVSGVDAYVKIEIRPNFWRRAYLQVLPGEVFMELDFGGFLTREELIECEKNAFDDFRVTLNETATGVLIRSVGPHRRIFAGFAPLSLRLGPIRTGAAKAVGQAVRLSAMKDGQLTKFWTGCAHGWEGFWTALDSNDRKLNRIILREHARNEFGLQFATTIDQQATISGLLVNAIEIDFDQMLSDAEIDQVANAMPEGYVASRVSDGSGAPRSILKLTRPDPSRQFALPVSIPIAFDQSAPFSRVRGTIRVRAISENSEPGRTRTVFKEKEFEVVGMFKSLRSCRVGIQSAATDRPICFARNIPRPIAVEIALKEPGFVRIPPGEPLLRLDFGKLLTASELVRLVENPPPGFQFTVEAALAMVRVPSGGPFLRVNFEKKLLAASELAQVVQNSPPGFQVAVEASTAILSPTTEVVIIREGEENTPLIVSLKTISFKDLPKNPDGEIRVGLVENGAEIIVEKIPYRVRELALSIRGSQETVRNERLYLKTKSRTNFTIEITPASHPPSTLPIELPFPQPSIEIDFGRVLSGEDVERLANAPQSPGFSVSKIIDTRTLRLDPIDKEFLISSKSAVTVPVEILPFEAPESKPYGTILISVKHGETLVAAEEFDLSINHQDGDSFATPPVVVMWDDSTPPRLKAGKPGQCRFAIFNARCDRRGNAKALVTDPWSPENETDPVKPRIRLSIPPTLQSGRAVEFNEGAFFADIEIAPASSKKRNWKGKALGNYQELYPDKQYVHVLEKDEHLVVTLDKIHARKSGTWSLAVTLVDFPGYSSATFLLPIEVGD